MNLIGREKELGELQTFTKGLGRVIAVQGPVASGKTALLNEYADGLIVAGNNVAYATASRAEAGFQFGVVRQIFSHPHVSAEAAGNIGLLLNDGVLSTILNEHQRVAAHVMGALWAELVGLSEKKPLVIIIDDIQYADASSMECILYFARRLRSSSIVIVLATTRHPWRQNSPLEAELMLLAYHRTLRLKLLSQPSVAGIVAEYYDARLAEVLAPAIYRASGGNPRLAMALLEDHRERSWKTGNEVIPGDEFGRVVQSSLSRCAPEVVRCARAVSVLEGPAHPVVLGLILDMPEDMAAALLSELTETGLVSAGRFRHPAIRLAVLGTMVPQDRAELHLRAAQALHRENAAARSIARQLIAAALAVSPGAEAWVTEVLREAAEQAMGECDLSLAIQCLQLVSRLCDGESDRAVVAAGIAAAEWRVDPGIVLRQISGLAGAVRDGHLRGSQAARVVYYQLWSGASEDAIAAMAGASLGELEASADAEFLSVQLWGASLYPSMAARLAPRGTRRPLHLASGRLLAAKLLVSDDRASELNLVAPATAESAPVAATLDDTTLAFIATAMAGSLYAGRSADMDPWSAAFGETSLLVKSPMRRSRTWRGLCAVIRAAIGFRIGDLSEAERQAREAITQVSPKSWGVLIGAPVALLTLAATARGRLDDVGEYLAIPVPDEMFRTMFGPLYLFARGCYYHASGKFRFALRDFEICGQLLSQWDPERSGLVPWRSAAALTQLSLGARTEATELLESAPSSRHDREYGLWLRARAAADQPLERLRLLKEAIAVFQECGDRAGVARSYADLSTVHEARGERGEARRTRRKATQLARQCGIETLPGASTGNGTERNTVVRAEELSEAERRVAVLAAHGYTNQEIASQLYITVSTVEQHLTRAYRKLKVNRRSDLPWLPPASDADMNGSPAPTLQLQRDVPMRAADPGAPGGQRPGEPAPGVRGIDDVVDRADGQRPRGAAGGRLVLLDEHGSQRVALGVGRGRQRPAVQDVDRRLGSHDGHLGPRPGEDRGRAKRPRVHRDVGAAERLARDQGHPGHGGLGERVQQLGAAPDDAFPFLAHAGQVARHVGQHDQRYPERVAHAHEPGGLLGAERVQAAALAHRVVGDDPDRPPGQPSQADHHVRGPPGLELREPGGRGIQQPPDEGPHVIGDPRRIGQQRAQLRPVLNRRRVERALLAEQRRYPACLEKGVVLRFRGQVHDTGAAVVSVRAAEARHVDPLAGHAAHHLGAGDEHACLRSHDDDVGERRAVGRAAGGRPEDDGDLRHEPGRARHGGEYATDALERVDVLAQPGARGVPEPDDRASVGHRRLDRGDDPGAFHGSDRAAGHGPVRAVREDRVAINPAADGVDASEIPERQLDHGIRVEQFSQPGRRVAVIQAGRGLGKK